MNKLFLILVLLFIFYYYFLINNKKEHFINNVNNITYNDKFKDYKFSNIYKNKTNFGDIIIAKNKKYGKCLVINEEIQLCDKHERIYHDMMVHFPMKYLNKDPEYVLIVGGGDLMTLREVMKYKSIKKVIMLELNKKIVNVCKKYFNVSDFKNNNKVKIIYGDADKTIDNLTMKFDIIINDTTEDNTTNLKIDKKEFFEKCYKLLNKNGLLVKNGHFFQEYFLEIFNKNVINYSFYIPYFQDYYYFTITGKKDLKNSTLRNFKIDYYYYNPKKHYNYINYDL